MHHLLLRRKTSYVVQWNIKKYLPLWVLIYEKLDSKHLTACLTNNKLQFCFLNCNWIQTILIEYCEPKTWSQQKQQQQDRVNFD